MSKIIKHTFEIPNLYVENGELVEGKPTEKTYTFTLLFKGAGLYEEIVGRTLFSDLVGKTKGKEDDSIALAQSIFDREFIQNLASVSYVKIVGDKFHNNHVTVEEFKKSPVFQLIGQDIDFIMKLVEMAMECIGNDRVKKNSKEVSSPKK